MAPKCEKKLKNWNERICHYMPFFMLTTQAAIQLVCFVFSGAHCMMLLHWHAYSEVPWVRGVPATSQQSCSGLAFLPISAGLSEPWLPRGEARPSPVSAVPWYLLYVFPSVWRQVSHWVTIFSLFKVESLRWILKDAASQPTSCNPSAPPLVLLDK